MRVAEGESSAAPCRKTRGAEPGAAAGLQRAHAGLASLFFLRHFLESSDPRQCVGLTASVTASLYGTSLTMLARCCLRMNPACGCITPSWQNLACLISQCPLTVGSPFSGHAVHTRVLYGAALESSHFACGAQSWGQGFCE